MRNPHASLRLLLATATLCLVLQSEVRAGECPPTVLTCYGSTESLTHPVGSLVCNTGDPEYGSGSVRFDHVVPWFEAVVRREGTVVVDALDRSRIEGTPGGVSITFAAILDFTAETCSGDV